MTEILDDIEPKETTQSGYVFTLLAVINAIIIVSIVYYISYVERIHTPSTFQMNSLPIIPLPGIIFTYFGFIRKERHEAIRWIAGSVNLLMFLFILASYIFAHLAFSGS